MNCEQIKEMVSIRRVLESFNLFPVKQNSKTAFYFAIDREEKTPSFCVDFAKNKNIPLNIELEDIKLVPGLGISAIYENKMVLIGSLSFLKNNGIKLDTKYLDFYNNSLKDGAGVILASIEKECIAVFALEDSIKNGAKELIADLKAKNIIPILLTGDNEITANYVAKKLNIDKVYSQVLPDEKYKVIIELQQDAKVMFVGDGINDSPSIKQADIGITLNSGSDITKDAGDIILINNELKAVLKSINLSIESMKIIKQNLFWAFIYNIGGIPLAAGVFYPILGVMLTPMYAGIAMSFSSVTVVLNSLRLKLKKI